MDSVVLVAVFLALASACAACVSGAYYQHRRREGVNPGAGPRASAGGRRGALYEHGLRKPH
jgi:hypothetical protein